MDLSQILIMRHELLLVIIAMVYLAAEIFTSEEGKKNLATVSIVLFAIATVIGFLPTEEGVLFGGMYHGNALNTLVKNTLNVGVLIILMQSNTWLTQNEDNKNRISEYFLLVISTLIGMNYMISSGDFLMFYLGLELATIPTAALVAYEQYKRNSAEAGVKLILSAALSSGVALFGISLIYGMNGSIYFADLVGAFGDTALHGLAFIFFFTGLAFKISIVPFHFWTADVYEGAPVNVTSYLSVISKGAAAFVLMTMLFKVFGTLSEMWTAILYITAILTMTIGNLFAIRQQNLKRFLAFSSIAQAGFIFLGMIAGSQLGMTSVIYFILIYVFSNLGAFGVVSIISNLTGKENMDDYNGLYRTNPKVSLVMTLALFSLAGIPPVAGFFGKFFLFTAAASKGYYWLVLIAVGNATISLYYYLLVVKAMFINKSENPIATFSSPLWDKLAMILCVLGIMLIGFYSNIYDYINTISWGI